MAPAPAGAGSGARADHPRLPSARGRGAAPRRRDVARASRARCGSALHEHEAALETEAVEPAPDRPGRHAELVRDLLDRPVRELGEKDLAKRALELALEHPHRRRVTMPRQHARQNALQSSARQTVAHTSDCLAYGGAVPGIPASRGLGLYIQRRREDLGMGQVEFSYALGWSQASLRGAARGAPGARRVLHRDHRDPARGEPSADPDRAPAGALEVAA